MPLDSMRFCEERQSMQHSKCFRSRERRVGSTPTISASAQETYLLGFFIFNLSDWMLWK